MADRSKYKPKGTIVPLPLLTEAATILMKALAQRRSVFEFGSGGSTLWMSKFVKKLISVEDDPSWHKRIAQELADNSDGRAEVRFYKTKELPNAIRGTGPWDIVFVDCFAQDSRRRAILMGAPYVKPGGWLIADDYHFPKTKTEVTKLKAAGWGVEILTGIKIHDIKKTRVKAFTAFCRKPRQ